MATIKLFELTDQGNYLKATGEPVTDATGLDGTQIAHRSWVGYPDLANAAVNDPKKLEGLTRARAKTQGDLDQAEVDWIAAEEALAEVS